MDCIKPSAICDRHRRYYSKTTWELLYADNLILMAESEESLCKKIVKWKSGMEVEGLNKNTGKTKR